MSRPAIKICGLTRPADAALAATLGASWVGVVLVPGTPRARTPAQARVIGEAARAGVTGRVTGPAASASEATTRRVSLAVVVANLAPGEASALAREAGADALQLHGDETPADLATLRETGPWELWKALRVRSGEELLPAAERWAGVADLLLVDAWHPHQLGGTGHAFDWAALEAVRSQWPPELRLGVAGGLRPETVAEAAGRLRPHLLDVSSGVESAPGVKDPARLQAFFRALRGGAASDD